MLLDELGFYPFIDVLREKYLNPVCQVLYPDLCGSGLDSHKAFIVQYSDGGDLDLGYHFDNAEVTLNVALTQSDSYKGGDLFFGSMRNELDNEKNWKRYPHKSYTGVLHRGQQRHGAYSLTSGCRYNLIVWMRASSVRNRKCPMCDLEPELEETVGYGDGFTRPTVDVCALT